MSVKIDFFLIGGQKCATTWLHHCLNNHPNITIGGGKRENIYLGGPKYKEMGEKWFFNHYPNNKGSNIYGSSSVEYLYNINSCKSIKNNNESAKIIVSIRNPYERLISAYTWYVRKGIINDFNFERDEKKILYSFTNNICDSYSDLLERGLYSKYLKEYFEVFEPEDIAIVFFDDIKSNPSLVLQHIYKFLDVNSEFIPKTIHRKPKKNTYFKALNKLERMLPKSFILNKIMNGLNEFVGLLGIGNKIEKRNENFDMQIRALYENEIRALNSILDKGVNIILSNCLSDWK